MGGGTDSPGSILVVKPSSLGDVVHTLPALASLKRRWPAAKMTWLVNPEWAPLLEGNPAIDRLLVFPRKQLRGFRGITKVGPWAAQMRRERFDLIVDFQGLLRSAMISRLVRAKRVLGMSDAREGAHLFYHETAQIDVKRHSVERYLQLVESLGIDVTDVPPAWLPEGTRPSGVELPGEYVLLHPFSRGAGKSLEAEEIETICETARPAVVAGMTDAAAEFPSHAVNLLNRTTLLELIWLIRNARAVVSVDSGPMHIAAAITSRLLSIHTWSDPRKVGPFNTQAFVWKAGRLSRGGEDLGARSLVEAVRILDEAT